MSDEITVLFKPSGSIHVHGPVRFTDADGNELVPPPSKVPGVVKLCGCGHSKDKPWCDGSHKEVQGRSSQVEGGA